MDRNEENDGDLTIEMEETIEFEVDNPEPESDKQDS